MQRCDIPAEYVKVISVIPVADLKQIIQNLQQALTIRIVEHCDDDNPHAKIHGDSMVHKFHLDKLVFFRTTLNRQCIVLIETLQLIFYANMFASKQPKVDDFGPFALIRSYENKAAADAGGSQQGMNRIESELKLNWGQVARPLIPYEEFENEILNDVIDIHMDFCVRFHHGDFGVEGQPPKFFTLQNYPFMLTTVNRTLFLFYDSKFKQHLMVQGQDESLPYLKISVSRSNLIGEQYDLI